MMRHLFQQWDTWWNHSVPPHALGLVRCVWGIFCFVYLIILNPDLTMIFSDHGVVVPLLAPLVPESLHSFFLPPSAFVAISLYIVLLLCLLSFAVGYRMRLSIVAVIALSLYFWQIGIHPFPATFHRFYLFAFLTFLISGADKIFSVRMLFEKGSLLAWEPISILPQRLLTVQLTLTYTGAMLQKLWLPDWQGGEVLYYSLFHAGATPLAYQLARSGLPMGFYDVLVWVVKLFEFTLFIGLWLPTVQRWFFLGGAMFHISVAFLFSIWSFLGFIPLYILFVPPEKVQRYCERFIDDPRLKRIISRSGRLAQLVTRPNVPFGTGGERDTKR